ncbi:UNVERIFIED_CONTAM: hypothetical protein GTU68_008255, partial [Idotea baltica]|nr:hypothetical protein [Idotea baltica]
NAKLYYETTVGAGLPIIGTIHDLLGSGDEIISIEAILSGTLSYLFNTYNAESSFADLVKAAQAEGITEPDPRDDLNGLDVARKLLILARESGHRVEMSNIEVSPPVPKNCLETDSVEEFYEELERSESTIADNYNSSLAKAERLRYIAVLERGSYRVKLKSVPRSHPFYELSGTDNILAITTKRYSQQPLVIRGPGAGVSVTAAGVFADILRVASFLE